MMTAGKNYFSGGLLSDDAIKEIKDKRLFEIVSVIAIVLILVTLVGINPQKTFWLFLCLFLLSANGIIETIIIYIDKKQREVMHG